MADDPACTLRIELSIFKNDAYQRDVIVVPAFSMKVDPSKTVAETIEAIAVARNEKYVNFGLFQPLGSGVMEATWLVNSQKLFGRVADGATLHLKYALRPVKIQIVGSQKLTLMLEDSLLVDEIIKRIATRIALPNPEEYGIKRADQVARLAADRAAAEASRRSFLGRGSSELPRSSYALWLRRHQTLEAQGVPLPRPADEPQLLFMKRLFYYDGAITTATREALMMLYTQTRDDYLNGVLHVPDEDAVVTLAAMIMVDIFGPYTAGRELAGDLELSNLVPHLPAWLNAKGLGEKIKEKFKSYRPGERDVTDAVKTAFVLKTMHMFRLTAAERLWGYGYVFFAVTYTEDSKSALTGRSKHTQVTGVFAIGRDCVVLYTSDAMDKEKWRHNYSELRTYSAMTGTLILNFAEFGGQFVVNPRADEVHHIASYLRDYLELQFRANHKNVDMPSDGKDLDESNAMESEPGPAGGVGAGGIPDKLPMADVSAQLSELNLDRKEVAEIAQPKAASAEAQLLLITQTKDEIQSNLVATAALAQRILLSALNTDPASFDGSDLLRAARELDTALNSLIGKVGVAAGITDDDSDQCIDDMKALVKKASQMVKIASVAALGSEAQEVDPLTFEDLLNASRAVGDSLKNLLCSTQVVGTANDVPLIPLAVGDLLAAAASVADALGALMALPSVAAAASAGESPLAAKVNALSLEANKLHAFLTLGQVGMEESGKQTEMAARIESLRMGLLSLDGLIAAEPAGSNAALLASAEALRDALKALIGAKEAVCNPADRAAEIAAKQQAVRSNVASLIEYCSRKATAKVSKTKLLEMLKGANDAAGQLAVLAALEAQSLIDSQLQKSILDANGALANSMTALRDATIALAKDAESAPRRAEVVAAASAVGDAAVAFMTVRRRIGALRRLTADIKAAVAAATAVTSEVDFLRQTPGRIRDTYERPLVAARDPVVACIPGLMDAVYVLRSAPNDPRYQKGVIAAAAAAASKMRQLLAAAKSAKDSMADSVRPRFASLVKDLDAALRSIGVTLQDGKEACWELDLDDFAADMQASIADAAGAVADQQAGSLKPESDATQLSALDSLLEESRAFASNSAAVQAAVLAADPAAATAGLDALRALVQRIVDDAEAVAVNCRDPSDATAILAANQSLAERTLALLGAAHLGLLQNSSPAIRNSLLDAAAALAAALAALTSAMPGVGHLERAIAALQAEVPKLDASKLSSDLLSASAPVTFDAASEEVVAAGHALSAAILELPAAATLQPDQTAVAVARIQSAGLALSSALYCAALLSPVKAARSTITGSGRRAMEALVAALTAAQAVVLNPEHDEATAARLAAAVAAVPSSVADLGAALRSGLRVPGDEASAACDAAAEAIAAAVARLLLPLPSMDELEFRGSQASLLAAAKALAEALAQLNLRLGKSGSPAAIAQGATALAFAADEFVSAAIAAAASLPGSGVGLRTDSFRAPTHVAKDALRDVVKAQEDGLADEAFTKVVGRVGRLVLELSKAVERKAASTALEPEVAAALKTHADGLSHATEKVVHSALRMVRAKEAEARETEKKAFRQRALAVAKAVHDLDQYAKSVGAPADGPPPPQSQGQTSLLSLTRALADELAHVVGVSKMLAQAPADVGVRAMLGSAAAPASAALDAVVEATRFAGPGQTACDAALKALAPSLAALTAAVLSASVGELDLSLPAGATPSLLINDLLNAAQTLAAALAALLGALSVSPAAVAAAAAGVTTATAAFATAAMRATRGGDAGSAASVLRLAKDVAEEVGSVLSAARVAGGEPTALEAIAATESGHAVVADSLAALQRFVTSLSSTGDDFAVALLNIEQATAALAPSAVAAAAGTNGAGASTKTYKDLSKALTSAAKKLVAAMTGIIEAASAAPASLGAKCKESALGFDPLSAAVLGLASIAASAPPLAGSLIDAARALADASRGLVTAAKDVASGTDTGPSRVVAAADLASAAIAALLSASKAIGAQQKASDEARRRVAECTAELDTARYLAAAGQLFTPSDRPFAATYAKLDEVCKKIVEAVVALMKGTKGPADALGAAAIGAADLMVSFATLVAEAAASLESSAHQVALLDGTKALAGELQSYFGLCARAQEAGEEPGPAKAVKESAKSLGVIVRDLLLAAKSARGAAMAGIEALTGGAAALAQAKTELGMGLGAGGAAATAEGVDGVAARARAAGAAASKLVMAATKTQDIIAARAGDATAAAVALLQLCGGCAALPGVTDDGRAALLAAASALADALAALMSGMAAAPGGSGVDEAKAQAIGPAVGAVVSASWRLMPAAAGGSAAGGAGGAAAKGGSPVEMELRAAAASIEEAAARLVALKAAAAAPPAAAAAAAASEQPTYKSSLLDEAQAMMVASAGVVRAATDCQAEIEASGRAHSGASYRADPKWADGLISAAREVVAGADQLVVFTDEFVRGEGSDAYVIAAAKFVSGATVHLLMAARAKAESLGSAPQRALDEASKAVQRAVKALAELATSALQAELDAEARKGTKGGAMSMWKAREQQELRKKKEAELEKLQRALNK